MAKRKEARGITRRQFSKLAGGGALAAGALGPAFLFPERALAQQKTLKIIQWSHFVPAWDTWFNGTYVKEWGAKNNTTVVVDNINLVDLPARAISRRRRRRARLLHVPRRRHSRVQVIDMSNVYKEVGTGKKIDLAHRPHYNRRRRNTSVLRAYTPDPKLAQDWWMGGIPERRTPRRPLGGAKVGREQAPPDLVRGAARVAMRAALVVRRSRAGRGRQRHD